MSPCVPLNSKFLLSYCMPPVLWIVNFLISYLILKKNQFWPQFSQDGSINSVSANAEVFLRARLEMRGVQIERIPDTSFRLCRCDKNKKRSSNLDHETVINCHNPSFYKHPCVWDEELGVGYTSQMESEHAYSRIVGRYVEACGWSSPMLLFASTQQLSRINDIERMLENEECFV